MKQAKALFFAQYLHQELTVLNEPKETWYPFSKNERGIFLTGVLNNKIIIRRIAEDVKDRFDQSCLLLRLVSQLSDDEFINVAKLVFARHNRHYNSEEITYFKIKDKHQVVLSINGHNRFIAEITEDGVDFMEYRSGGAGRESHYCPAQFAVTDYFRSIGVLLPFTYLNEHNQPITLKPAEIFNLGWAQYKSS